MKSNNMLGRISDFLFDLLFPVSRFESKLKGSTRYREKTVTQWKRQLGLRSATSNKILESLQIFDGHRIRGLIKAGVKSNPDIFLAENCFISRFGEAGKSGEVIFYEFCHAAEGLKRIDDPWRAASLPPGSRIVFVDDLIGTGTQSLDFIKTRLSSTLQSSHRPCLFSVCGTPRGIKAVRDHSTFEVVCALELEESAFNYYDGSNKVFSPEEKQQIQELNERLGQNFFVMGLLVAFFYSTPDNTMPFIWNDGVKFQDGHGRNQSWFALLPRKS